MRVCAEDLRAPQRIVIVLLDRTGSMATRFRDPETRIELTRLQHSWRYLNRDLKDELSKGVDNLSVYFLPFSREPDDKRDPFAKPVKISANSTAEIEAQIKNFERKIGADGETDIVWAVDRAVELLESLKIDKLSAGERANVRLILYSDGGHNVLRLPNGAQRAYADEDIDRDPRLKQQLQTQLEAAFRRLYKFFDNKKESLAGDLDIFHWGNNPVEEAIKDLKNEKPENFNVGNNPVDKPTGKIDVIEFADVRVIKQGDGARIAGQVKVTARNVASATLSVKLGAPYETVPAFTKGLAALQGEFLDTFSLEIPRSLLKRKSKVTIEAKITDAQQTRIATGGLYVGKGATMVLIVGTDASIGIESPADGVFREVFEDMTLAEPQSALLKLRWNDAAKDESIHLALANDPALTVRVEPLKADGGGTGAALNVGAYKLSALFGNAQSGALRITLTANQKFAPTMKDLMAIGGVDKDAMAEMPIKALIKVSPPRVFFDGLSKRTCEYDSDQIARPIAFPALLIKPSAGVQNAEAEIALLNLAPEKFKDAELWVQNETRVEGKKIAIREPVVVFVRFTPADAKALDAYKPGDLTLNCKLADSKIDRVFGYGFDKSGQLPLAVDFADAPHFKVVKLTGPDGKAIADSSQPFTLHVGEQREFTLHCAWNSPAVGKVVGHPFASPIKLGVAQLEAVDLPKEWTLDDSRARQIKLLLTATEIGKSDAATRELGLSGMPSEHLNFPALEVLPAAFQFSVELRGDGDNVIAPSVPLMIQAGVPQSLSLNAKWDERAAGKTVVHRLNDVLNLDGLARLEAEEPVGEWTLDANKLHREIRLKLTGLAEGKVKARSLSFSIGTSFVAPANLPPLQIFVPTFSFKSHQDRPLELSPGKSVLVTFTFDDATEPKLPDTFWRIGGKAETLTVNVEPSDADFFAVFSDGNSPSRKLSELKPGNGVPMVITYKGSQSLTKAQAKNLALKFSLSSHGAPPPIAVVNKTALSVNVEPVIPYWLWDLLLLGAPIGLIAWLISKKGKSALPGLQPAVASAPPSAAATAPSSVENIAPIGGESSAPVSMPSFEPNAPTPVADAPDEDIDHISDAGSRF
ncbi:MAG TPA: hypothetical protein VKX17_23525 [Planctomycetota bacterium]|nr:hypothetical protein [Planctomycetota bacterium]